MGRKGRVWLRGRRPCLDGCHTSQHVAGGHTALCGRQLGPLGRPHPAGTLAVSSPFPTPFPCPGRHLGLPGPHSKGSLPWPSHTCVLLRDPVLQAQCSARQHLWSCSQSSSSANEPAPFMDNKVCPVATSGQLVTAARCQQVSRGPRGRTHHWKPLSSRLPAERLRAPILYASLCPQQPELRAGSSLRFPLGPGLRDSSDGFPRTQGTEPQT